MDQQNYYEGWNPETDIQEIKPEMDQDPKEPKKKKPKKNFTFLKKAGILCLAGILFGTVASASYQGYRYFTSDVAEGGDSNQDMADSGSNGEDGSKVEATNLSNITSTDVSSIVENAIPSVVAINCITQSVEYDFFGQGRAYDAASSGTGFIIAQDKEEILIATNNHVVADASKIEIQFDDGTKAEATLKGADAYYDLAVIAVPIKQLTEETLKHIKIATLGDSDAMKMGSMVIAIGNALGYGQSTTVGYVSALNREVMVDNITMNLLQSDAAINPGNSGGPLLNSNGEVIGVNSVKYSSQEVEGIGYAIPTSIAVPIINELMNRETLQENESGYLGIVGKDVAPSYAQSLNMPAGIYVYSVAENTPAEEAGLKPGDIITGINGRTVASQAELGDVLSYTRAGTKVTLQIRTLQEGQYIEKEVEVSLGARPNAS